MANKNQMKTIKVAELLKRFDHEILHKGNLNTDKIYSPTLNRVGLELAYCNNPNHQFHNINSTVLLGTNESEYLLSLKDVRRVEKAFKKVIDLTPPVIILCEGFDRTLGEIFKKVAVNTKAKTTIVYSSLHLHQLYLAIAGWINEQLAEYTLIHGTLMSIDGMGVLIQGESGVGKSEVALQLIRQNALFIADDAVEATNLGNKIFAKSSDIAGKFLEVRGIGLINIIQMFGVSKVKSSSTIDLVITLIKSENVQRQYFERVGEKQQYLNILNASIPHYRIPVTYGRDVANMIQAAVADYKMRSEGYNSASEYINKLNSILKNK
ncbi:HPr kinase/phosphatase [Candidatus Malacoplasma girerdii]|uniref:HPr kinase/phosphatase n=1 Tax=Candidatus Malacoplasma girerdii TaxID=1318617 RepID=A0A097ST86_9BACT|nr:HPr kinase/phosphatase [Candidatus Malacoplasma girerdii]ASJ89301.1 MAG: HPr kinase/phosphorylase [Candidatus Malacoplasma girerdii]